METSYNTDKPLVNIEKMIISDVSDSISFTDEFNDDATIKLNKGKRLEIVMIDAHGNDQTYFYLDKEMVEKLKMWL
jgi:hypothetical protein